MKQLRLFSFKQLHTVGVLLSVDGSITVETANVHLQTTDKDEK